MKVLVQLFALVFLIWTHSMEGAIESAVVTFTTEISGGFGVSAKANGLLLRLDRGTYVVTVGHPFRQGSISAEVITSTGDHGHASLDTDFFDVERPVRVDVAILKTSLPAPDEREFTWQSGRLLDEHLKKGGPVVIHNGAERLDGYTISDSEKGAESIQITSKSGVNLLQGFSGGVVEQDGIVVGLVRAHNAGKVDVLRIDSISRTIAQELGTLPCGDVDLLAKWARERVDQGLLLDAKRLLDRANDVARECGGEDALARWELMQIEVMLAIGPTGETYEGANHAIEWFRRRRTERMRGVSLLLMARLNTVLGWECRSDWLERHPPDVFKVQFMTERFAEGAKQYEMAADLLYDTGEPELLGRAMIGQAKNTADVVKAEKLYREVIAFSAGKYPETEVRAVAGLKSLRWAMGWPEEALGRKLAAMLQSARPRLRAELLMESENDLDTSIALFKRYGSEYEVAVACEHAGDAASDPNQALLYYQQAYDFYRNNPEFGGFAIRVAFRSVRILPLRLSGLPVRQNGGSARGGPTYPYPSELIR